MVEFIIGDYSPKKTDVLCDNFHPDIVYKKKNGNNSTVVIFADFVGLTKDDAKFIANAATKDVKVILNSGTLISGIRQGKNVKITYIDGNSKDLTPFALASACLNITDRNYLFEFLKFNKPQMFMLVKALIGGMTKITKANLQWVAWLDMHQWKVMPEIMYAIIAFKIKPQPEVKYLPWLYPKKSEQ